MHRRALVLVALLGCQRDDRATTSAPALSAPIARCGDLGRDSIAGVQVDVDEAAVLKQLGPPTFQTPARESFNPNYAKQPWYSTATWLAHDLRVTFVGYDSATAPRKVYSVSLGALGDLATSCNVRVGASRAEIERAYRDAIDVWQAGYADAAERGFISAPSGVGSAPDTPIMLLSVGGGIVGLLSFAADRLIGIELTHASVLYANQW
jgi:hypothetical protein